MVEEPIRLPKIARDVDDFTRRVEKTLREDPVWREYQERARQETIDRQDRDYAPGELGELWGK